MYGRHAHKHMPPHATNYQGLHHGEGCVRLTNNNTLHTSMTFQLLWRYPPPIAWNLVLVYCLLSIQVVVCCSLCLLLSR